MNLYELNRQVRDCTPSVEYSYVDSILSTMVSDRITVSLDDETRGILEDLVSQTGQGNSELVRRALTFYATNLRAARSDVDIDLEEYHEMLSTGEHALFDIDFLHILLAHVQTDDGEWPETFVEDVDRVAHYHALEYEGRYSELRELLEWLSICGFLTVRESEENTYHVVFPTEDLKWFMLRFIEKSTETLPFEVEIEEGVSKALMTEKSG